MKRSLICSLALVALLGLSASPARAGLYLVEAGSGPTFHSTEEAVAVLEKMILPMFDALQQLEKDGRIRAGGLPVGDRAFTFILEADSNDDADQTLRNLPAWPLFRWEVTALQTFAGRGDKERAVVAELKKAAQETK